MPSNPLAPGVHAWLWPLPANERAFAAKVARAVRLGIRGLILQDGLAAPGWLGAKANRACSRIAADAGIQLTAGLGMDGREGHKAELSRVSDAWLACLAVTPAGMLNWESQWGNEVADKSRAAEVVTRVLSLDPSAAHRTVDAPWWAPLYVERVVNGRRVRRWTHPGAPTAEFGAACKYRFVQAYGANVPGSPDGASANMLAWARHPSQYASLGTPVDRVLFSGQGYYRSVADGLYMYRHEPVSCLWQLDALDAGAEAALLVQDALAKGGYPTLAAFQREAGLVVDDKIGPASYARLLGAPALETFRARSAADARKPNRRAAYWRRGGKPV